MRCQHVMYKSGTHEMRGRVAASHIRHPLRGNKKEQRRTDCDSRVREEGGGMMKTDDNESEGFKCNHRPCALGQQ